MIMRRTVNSSTESKIPYTLVSMAAILRDYADMSEWYKNDLHEKLTDIADSLYNVGIAPDEFKTEYKELYDQYGKAYFDKVLDDMYALDGQLTSDAKVQELIDDYNDRLSGITASTKVTAATNYDTKLIAKWLKAKFDDEAFGTAYTMHRISDADAYMSRNGLTYNRKNNTIDLWKSGGDEDLPIYKVIPQYSSTKRQGTYAPKMPKLVPIDDWNATHGVTASTKVTASQHWREKTECKTKNGKITRMQNISSIFNDVDYYILYDANGKFVEKSIDFNYLHDKLYDVGNDDSQPSPAAKFLKGHPLSIADVESLWDILPMYVDFGDSDALLQENGYTLDQASEFLRQGYSIYVDASTNITASDNPFYDKLSDYGKHIVDNQRKQFSPITFDVYNALLPYIGEYSSNTGWTGSCELMKGKDITAVDGYIYNVVWDNKDVDSFTWMVNDNPRVGGDFTLMVMYAYGMPDFCDSEKDFYRAVRKVFGDGLKKIN